MLFFATLWRASWLAIIRLIALKQTQAAEYCTGVQRILAHVGPCCPLELSVVLFTLPWPRVTFLFIPAEELSVCPLPSAANHTL